MGIFKRIINIVHSDISAIIDKLESRQKTRDHDSQRYDHNSDNFKNNDYTNSNHYSNYHKTNSNKHSNFQDEKLTQYYANLELPYGADLETSKKAWKRLMKKYHPDLYSNDQSKVDLATQLTSKLNEAFKAIEKSLTH